MEGGFSLVESVDQSDEEDLELERVGNNFLGVVREREERDFSRVLASRKGFSRDWLS